MYRKNLILAALFLLMATGIAVSQQFNTSGRWVSGDIRHATSNTEHLGVGVVGDLPTNDRLRIRSDGALQWGSGSSPTDTSIQRTAASTLTVSSGDTLEAETITGIGAAALTLGSVATTQIAFTTDNATASIDGSTNQFRLTATGTNSPTFVGADAATPADTIFDTLGAGTVQVGSADVTSMTLVADGGTVTVDGSVTSDANDMGWNVVAGANTACTTTCTSACVFGVNTASATADIVDCADATADECLCAGAS